MLLVKLAEKEADLEARMRLEKNEHKQRRLGKALEIIKARHAKGMKTLRSLEEP
ncbi:MAG: hypothetical protein WBP44_03360 [Gammaproteobacteria bacterium]|jgi:hypothetical protein